MKHLILNWFSCNRIWLTLWIQNKKKYTKFVFTSDVKKRQAYSVRIALRFSREPISASMRVACNLCRTVRAELISVTTAAGQIGCNAGLPRESPSLCPGTHNQKQYVSNALRSSSFFLLSPSSLDVHRFFKLSRPQSVGHGHGGGHRPIFRVLLYFIGGSGYL